MPNFFSRRWQNLQNILVILVIIFLTLFLTYYHWAYCFLGVFLGISMAIYMRWVKQVFQRDFTEYVSTLSYRIKSVGNEVITQFPMGIVIYDEEKKIQWHNRYIRLLTAKPSIVGESLPSIFPGLQFEGKEQKESQISVGEATYKLDLHAQERVLYIMNVTDQVDLETRYNKEKLVLGIVVLDNFSEVTQELEDQQRALLFARISNAISKWATQYDLMLRRLASDRYLVIANQKSLQALEESRFAVLDDIKELTDKIKQSVTLSIGFATGSQSVVELGQLVEGSLAIALSRGGDQAVVKFDRRQSFYGGKSNAIEKRTRVRARIIAHAMRDLMQESDCVFIMGHKNPDMDCIGAAVGVVKAAKLCNTEAFIVLDNVPKEIEKMMAMIQEDEELFNHFISSEQALADRTKRSLVVVVDAHRENIVAEPRLLQQNDRVVLIDHHRRSTGFIEDAVLIYMEPYASSACELVTELLQYIQDRVPLSVREATVLLAGITLDTRSFAFRTGSRTFEAASFLRQNGADSALIQGMMKEDLEEYINKGEIIRRAVIHFGCIAIAVGEEEAEVSQLLIAQSADTLLDMTGIKASFVIAKRLDGLTGISARSLGEINVQMIMEHFDGGGHFTNAAAQVEDSIAEVEEKLKAILQQFNQEERLT